eukprot:2452439-Pleurochrysis_carterae.AAC.1
MLVLVRMNLGAALIESPARAKLAGSYSTGKHVQWRAHAHMCCACPTIVGWHISTYAHAALSDVARNATHANAMLIIQTAVCPKPYRSSCGSDLQPAHLTLYRVGKYQTFSFLRGATAQDTGISGRAGRAGSCRALS